LEISPLHPASILRQHPRTTSYLDTESAALLKQRWTTQSPSI
jgi:6-phosphogluconolactonase/glucosamine-6-phosphate isomerase/deaminase